MRPTVPLIATALAAAVPATATEVVPVSGFRSIELRGGGVVTVVPGRLQRVAIVEGSSQFTRMSVERDGKLRIDTCNDRCPQRYRLRIEIQSPRVPDLAIAGGGIIATGSGFGMQPHLSAAVNGGGKIDARSVEAVGVSAAVNGGGELAVRPRSTLSAAVNGGGHVRYCGRPAVSMAVHGGGAVSPGC